MATSDSYPKIISAAPWAREKGLTFIPKDGLFDFINSIICNNQDLNKEPFYVLDLGALLSLMQKWSRSLPAVRPFYAVKCNPEPVFLSAMAALGAGFDCASRAEIETVLSLGVSPDRIIYANPCKIASHIKYAASVGVNLTTFDSVAEIEKIGKYHPNSACLIRIKADDGGSRYPLGSKYGAIPEEFEELLLAAQSAKLAVSGVSFHVGSLASDFGAYRAAIGMAKTVFDMASRLRMPPMHVLDIGGGFSSSGSKFEDAANAVESALREYFPNEPGLTVIAEPGRFFAESVFTLATNIFGKRVRGEVREYWINDGVYGSMNILLTDNLVLEATPFACVSNAGDPTCRGVERTYSSTVFGPTCDAGDTVVRGQELPELEVNDWLVFPNMGAYTRATGTNFNGFRTSDIKTHLVYSNPN